MRALNLSLKYLKPLMFALLCFIPYGASADDQDAQVVERFVWHYEEMGFVIEANDHAAVLMVENHAGPGATGSFTFDSSSLFRQFEDLWNKAKKLPPDGEIGSLTDPSGHVLILSMNEGTVEIGAADSAQSDTVDCKIFEKNFAAFDKSIKKVKKFLHKISAK